ncbi:Rap1a/Tai family immunity protein [Oricola sp.]|uniref:Rap1a/Tai family immunity protein n=1 Tax=Oricola sp. TaxID=1979950 RepID=UPI003BAA3DB2
MRSILATTATLALLASVAAAPADSFSGTGYLASDLLSPCQESDNDARWGEYAETECEQYILGFVDALKEVGATGPDTGLCPPEVNTADEVRWAYMRWVHKSYTKRTKMPAADALFASLKENFACE